MIDGIEAGVYFDLEEMKEMLESDKWYTVPNGLKTYEDFEKWINEEL